MALEVEAAECFEAEHNALGVGGLEAAGGGGDEVLGGAGVPEGLLHQDQRGDIEEAVRNLPLEAQQVRAQLPHGGGEGGAEAHGQHWVEPLP